MGVALISNMVNDAFAPNSGLTVSMQPLTKDLGQFDPLKPNGIILIDVLLAAFQDGQKGAQILLDSTVEHKVVHALDFANGDNYKKDGGIEEGKEYEKAVYGSDLRTFREARDYDNKQD
ncbi:hypothetical protein [Paraglaciecola sp. 25GB23A]|uniref:hypothetical protein n=1 Tax=Paraglaciecola sp. 25GB23A TaxID=3156068 RepID=UPI0032AEBBFD